MTNILYFLLVVSWAQTSDLHAGTVRDGGDEPITNPEWRCVSENPALGMEVHLAWQKPEVQLRVAGFDFVYEGGLRQVFRSSTEEGDDLGFTDSTVHFSNHKMDMALSIYFEQKDANDNYRGRISVKIAGLLFHRVRLICDHTPPSMRTDYVEYSTFDL